MGSAVPIIIKPTVYLRPHADCAMPRRGLIFACHLRQVNILKPRLGIADGANMHAGLGAFCLAVITDHFRQIDINGGLLLGDDFRLLLRSQALKLLTISSLRLPTSTDSAAISRSAITGFLSLSRSSVGRSPFMIPRRAARRSVQVEPGGDFLDAVFNGDACHDALRGSYPDRSLQRLQRRRAAPTGSLFRNVSRM